MLSKLLCFAFIFAFFIGCDEEKPPSVFEEKKCNASILGPEIESIILNCRRPVETAGEVILSFYFDEKGAPQKIRNNFASKSMPDNLECAVSTFKEFRSKSLKNCHAAATFIFTKPDSKDETSLAELNPTMLEEKEPEQRGLFQDYHADPRDTAVSENIPFLAHFSSAIEKHPRAELLKIKILSALEEHSALDEPARLGVLQNTKMSRVHMLELIALYVKLTNDEFERTFPIGKQLSTAQLHLHHLTELQSMSTRLREDDVEAANWIVDFYVVEVALQIAKIARTKEVDWLSYNKDASQYLSSLKRNLFRAIKMRVKKRFLKLNLPDTNSPSANENSARIRKEEISKLADQLKKIETLRNQILEHRLKDCPPKALLMVQRSILKDFLDKTTNASLEPNYFINQKKIETIKDSVPTDRRRISKILRSGLREKSICWLGDWEREFRDLERERRTELEKVVNERQLDACLRPDEQFSFSIVVEANGKTSDLKIFPRKKLTSRRKQKLNRCLRKKINLIRFPGRPTGAFRISMSFSTFKGLGPGLLNLTD